MGKVKNSARCAGTSTPNGRSCSRPASAPIDLGYDTLWTWDHLYPIVGASDGPNYEGWLTITAWAQATDANVRIGLMVGADTFRRRRP